MTRVIQQDSLSYELYDVFTEKAFSGNPLAVFLNAGDLSADAMQVIAGELNLSETVFISPAELKGRYNLRIFTPKVELPFAGHPTIGAAIALRDAREIDRQVTFDVKAGDINVQVSAGRAGFDAPSSPMRRNTDITSSSAAALLGLKESDIAEIHAADAGVPFLIIFMNSRRALGNIVFSSAHWRTHLASSATPHVYAVHWPSDRHNIDARMFAPAMGIEEDPATGGAAAALGALLPQGTYTISQGEDMGRASKICLEVKAEGAAISGAAVLIGSGALLRPACSSGSVISR